MALGFIHGVMNTDNCSISGETIDYGPCAFMDAFHQGRVFSSIDRQGRYAYGNQPQIVVWNMAQLATSLLQQMEDKESAVEEATEIVHDMPDLIEAAWLRRFAAKIGISTPRAEDVDLINELLGLMQRMVRTSPMPSARFPQIMPAISSPTAMLLTDGPKAGARGLQGNPIRKR